MKEHTDHVYACKQPTMIGAKTKLRKRKAKNMRDHRQRDKIEKNIIEKIKRTIEGQPIDPNPAKRQKTMEEKQLQLLEEHDRRIMTGVDDLKFFTHTNYDMLCSAKPVEEVRKWVLDVNKGFSSSLSATENKFSQFSNLIQKEGVNTTTENKRLLRKITLYTQLVTNETKVLREKLFEFINAHNRCDDNGGRGQYRLVIEGFGELRR